MFGFGVELGVFVVKVLEGLPHSGCVGKRGGRFVDWCFGKWSFGMEG